MTPPGRTEPAAPDDPLPDGFVLRLKESVRVEDGGAALLGGFPTRALYLSQTARNMMRGGELRVTGPGSAALARKLLDTGFADPVIDRLPDLPSTALTVVIPVYNRPDALDRLLGSIGGRYPVIVVDDASPDPAAIAAVTDRHRAELVVLPGNVGPADARNVGIGRVRTPFVALVDSDMVLDPDTVPMLLRHFNDPRVALAAPRVLGLTYGRANWISRYEDARSALDIGRHPSLVRPQTMVSWLPAACMVARTQALGAGFGRHMRVAEDVDLVWRLDAQGWHIRYEPTVLGHHEHRTHLGEWLARRAFYGTGADVLAHRHPDQISPAIFTPWTAILTAAVFAQRRWSLPVAAGAAAVAAVRTTTKLRRNKHPARLAVRLTGNYAIGALFQGNALLLRHWWPATAIAALFSRRVRRAALVAAIVDITVEWGRTRPDLDPVRFGLLRRLDDLAYGGGLWFGVLRGRSPRALQPVIRNRHPERKRSATTLPSSRDGAAGSPASGAETT